MTVSAIIDTLTEAPVVNTAVTLSVSASEGATDLTSVISQARWRITTPTAGVVERSGQSTSYTPTEPGSHTFDVDITVPSSSGPPRTASASPSTVEVLDRATSSIEVDNDNPRVGDTVAFTASVKNSTGADFAASNLSGWSWNLGTLDAGGNTTAGTTARPSHAFSVPGDFSISFTVQLANAQGLQRRVTGALSLTVQASARAGSTTTKKWITIKTPDYDTALTGTQRSYLRLGARSDDEVEYNGFDASGNRIGYSSLVFADEIASDPDDAESDPVQVPADGHLLYVDGNSTEIVQGNREIFVNGAHRMTINGGGLGLWDAAEIFYLKFRQVGTYAGKSIWRKTVREHSASDTYSFGDSESFHLGWSFGASLGFSCGISFSGSLQASVSADVSASASFAASISAGQSVSMSKGGELRLTKKASTAATKSISLMIEPSKSILEGGVKPVAAGLGAAFGALFGGAAAGTAAAILFTGVDDSDVDADDKKDTWGARIGIGLGTAIWAGALIAARVWALKNETTKIKNISTGGGQGTFFYLSESLVEIAAKSARITMLPSGLTQIRGDAYVTGKLYVDGETTFGAKVQATELNVDGTVKADKIDATSEVSCRGAIKNTSGTIDAIVQPPPQVPVAQPAAVANGAAVDALVVQARVEAAVEEVAGIAQEE